MTPEQEILLLWERGIFNTTDFRSDHIVLKGNYGLAPKGFDEYEVYLYPATRVAEVYSYNISHHNGVSYGEKQTSVPWDDAIKAVYPTMKQMALGWIAQEEQRAAEANRKQIQESKYQALLARLAYPLNRYPWVADNPHPPVEAEPIPGKLQRRAGPKSGPRILTPTHPPTHTPWENYRAQKKFQARKIPSQKKNDPGPARPRAMIHCVLNNPLYPPWVTRKR